MRSDITCFGLLFAGASLLACAAGSTSMAPTELVRYQSGSHIQLSADRVAEFVISDGHAQLDESAHVTRLSALDFGSTHALAADLTGDGVSDLLVEVLPSRSGSCYELWSSTPSGHVEHEDLFCNPVLGASGVLVTSERDGPYSRTSEYMAGNDGVLRWVQRQEPLSPDFGRLVEHAEGGSAQDVVIFLGLPGCGEAHVTVQQPVSVSMEPATPGSQLVAGELRILDVDTRRTQDQQVRVQAYDGVEGWLPSSQLGDLEAAAKSQCRRTQRDKSA